MMIKCPSCNNAVKFKEILKGGFRSENYEQLSNGRWEFVGSDASRVDEVEFQCGECGRKLNSAYKKFLEALFAHYDESKHGP